MLLASSSSSALSIVICVIWTITKAQNYAERSGSLRTNADVFPSVTDNDFDITEYYYDWSQMESDVFRWNVAEYPHPQLKPSECNRKQPGNLCDPDNILSQHQANQLDVYIRQFYNNTGCLCKECKNPSTGIQIGIALLKYIYQPYSEHPSKVIHSFSKNLRSKWRLGNCDDDVLIVVVTQDRQSFTDVGSVLKQYISLDQAYTIFIENKAHFTAGNYFEGLRGMLKQYLQASKDVANSKEDNKIDAISRSALAGIVSGIVLVLFVVVIVTVFFYVKYKKSQNSRVTNKSKWSGKEPSCCKHLSNCLLISSSKDETVATNERTYDAPDSALLDCNLKQDAESN